MSKLPSISIIVPTYNHAHFLKDSIGSVLAQTFMDFEVVVVNNFSTDNTEDVIKSFGDERIRLVNFRNNGIIAASRNKGAQEAKANLIAFLDSDDSWLPQKLEICLKAMTNDVDLVCHNEFIVENGKCLSEKHYGPEQNFTPDYLIFTANCLSPSAVLIKKDLYLKVGGMSENPDVVTAEDYDCWIKLSKIGVRGRFINQALGNYNLHQSNNSSAIEKHRHAVATVVETQALSMKNSPIFSNRKLIHRLAFIEYVAARSYIDSGQFNKAYTHLLKAIKQFPFFLRPYYALFLLLRSRLNA